MVKRDYLGKSILNFKDKYVKLYEYLKTLNINLENIYIVEMPYSILYYLEDLRMYTTQQSLQYKKLDEIKYHLKYSKVYIFPEEEIYEKMNIPAKSYSEYLRVFLTENDDLIKRQLRKDKFKRLLK